MRTSPPSAPVNRARPPGNRPHPRPRSESGSLTWSGASTDWIASQCRLTVRRGGRWSQLKCSMVGMMPDKAETWNGQEQPLSRIPAARVALATILERIVSKRYHYPIGRIGMQKIAYFATRAGIGTGLQFERRSYGLHATGLKKVIASLINNGLIEEQRRGRMFVNKPGPTLADGQLVFKKELEGWEREINQVVDLFRRLPSSRWAELVASVDYTAELLINHNKARGAGRVQEQRVVEEVERWKKGRNPRRPEMI